MPVEEQVAVIYGASNGYVDSINLKYVRNWEVGALEYLKMNHPGILTSIRKESKIMDDTEKQLKEALASFTAMHTEWR
jgi:F-type H+-transporting ATPase subunit alpha